MESKAKLVLYLWGVFVLLLINIDVAQSIKRGNACQPITVVRPCHRIVCKRGFTGISVNKGVARCICTRLLRNLICILRGGRGSVFVNGRFRCVASPVPLAASNQLQLQSQSPQTIKEIDGLFKALTGFGDKPSLEDKLPSLEDKLPSLEDKFPSLEDKLFKLPSLEDKLPKFDKPNKLNKLNKPEKIEKHKRRLRPVPRHEDEECGDSCFGEENIEDPFNRDFNINRDIGINRDTRDFNFNEEDLENDARQILEDPNNPNNFANLINDFEEELGR